MYKTIITFIFIIFSSQLHPQISNEFIDSLRTNYSIPELSYAIVSNDSILAINALGEKWINSGIKADLADRYRIGSNTKGITATIAALLVKEGKIEWNTRFFTLFPELKNNSNRKFHKMTLLDLLSFRVPFPSYTYTNENPTKDQFTGNFSQQRYQLIEWFLKETPIKKKKEYYFSNLSYVAAGLMLEKVSNKSYEELVKELGQKLNIDFDFGNPCIKDTLQTKGHNHLFEIDSSNNFKLNWLLAAGNINVNLPDYCKFIQFELSCFFNKSPLLNKTDFELIHFGFETFSIGWFSGFDELKNRFCYNIGNPGSFYTAVYIFPEQNLGIILFSNIQSPKCEEAFSILFSYLKEKYTRNRKTK